MADLHELFARLNSQGTGAQASSQSGSYQMPSASSPIFSPAPTGPQPHHQSAVISPNTSAANTPAPEQSSSDRQASLLNLLRFNQSANAPSPAPAASERRQPQSSQSTESPAHGRTTSASDLVASFMRKTSPQGAAHSSASTTPAPATKAERISASTENPQDLLLRLLNQPKPQQPAGSFSTHTSQPETAVADVEAQLNPTTSASIQSPTMRVFGHDGAAQSSEPEALEQPAPAKPSAFTYVNPFEQFPSPSPRNRTPVPDNKPPAPKMEILKPKHSRDPAPAVGGESHQHETVSEAVSGLGEQVDKQVEEALAQADTSSNGRLAKETVITKAEVREIKEAVHDTAVEIKKELEDEGSKREFEKTLPKPMAKALEQVVKDVAEADVADSWESAEADESPSKDEERIIKVYRFPMKAFASITVKKLPERRPTFHPDSFMDIARLKKEFDQIDRSLVASSKNFIVYALAKNGGFRIIRQENGDYRQVFQNHHERIFNVALCAGSEKPEEVTESILGIGVNGTVFWTSLVASREDQIEDLDAKALVLPPSPAQDDNTSGGQLKTRAKPSCRNPEFFAVGRGKSIHIVWPKVAAEYLRPKTRICNTEKYLKERSLKILTGKAGKDFTFSADDTVIVSLDKAGRMRFWDIRPLTDSELGKPNNPPQTVEVSQTLLEFHTTSPTTKSWPTSVFFFDKDKPFNKGIALRYVMVGMKQNHTFQLWDLGLGKAVQEINLPHEKESDAICSVAFHPRTGIMAVAHPTRNSIYFIHVSCPRYNLPVFSQAGYIHRLANKHDKTQTALPPVNATAIMTSITEYTFSSKGQIRSIDMLSEPIGPPDTDDPENNPLFELYIMHSKGVCTLTIRRSDIGWKKEGEPLYPVDAEPEDLISLSQLTQPKPITDEASTSGDTPARSTSDRSVRESIKKESSSASRQSMTPEAAMRASTLAKVESKQDAVRAAIINGSEKSEKKKKKRANAETASQLSSAKPPSYAQAAQAAQAKTPSPDDTPIQSGSSPRLSTAAPTEQDHKKLEDIVHNEITKGLTRELEALYKRIEEDKRVQAAANAAKQDAVLRLVSSTLTENVDKTLVRMVDDSVRNTLLPQIMSNTTSTLEKSIGRELRSTLNNQFTKDLPDSVNRALKDPQVLSPLSDLVARKVAGNFESLLAASLGSVISPALSGLKTSIEHAVSEQLRQANVQRHTDAANIDQLTGLVQNLTQTVQSMATAQTELHDQITKLQNQLSQTRNSDGLLVQPPPQTDRSSPKKTPEQLEIENITSLMAASNYEQGTMQWLQSSRTAELFDEVFVRCNPAYLNQVSALLALSTGAVVTEIMDKNIAERLSWLEAVLSNVDPHDPEIADIVPRIMDVLNQRLTAAYIKLNEESPGNPLLRKISALVTRVNGFHRAVLRQ